MNTGITVRIRERNTLSSDGSISKHLSVHCPKQERTMALDACLSCRQQQLVDAAAPLPAAGAEVSHLHQLGSLVCPYLSVATSSASVSEALEQAKWRKSDSVPVMAMMTHRVLCVRRNVSIESLVTALLEWGISGAPVVDRFSRPIGVVSKTDLIRRHFEGEAVSSGWPAIRPAVDDDDLSSGFSTGLLQSTTVQEIMNPLPLTVTETTSVGHAAAVMAYEGIHRIFVCCDEGAVVGTLTGYDIMRWLAIECGYVIPDPRTHAWRRSVPTPSADQAVGWR